MIIQETLSGGLQLSITQSCHALEVSRSGYFKWRNQPGAILFENSENADLRDQIQEIALEFPGYGYCVVPKVFRTCSESDSCELFILLLIVRTTYVL